MSGLYDVGVVGLGAMGSAAAYSLARRGETVLGLDQFTPPHTLGSSHGSTRIIRQAYFEHPLYVPLVQEAQRLWEELQQRDKGKRRLLLKTGGIMVGPSDGTLVSGARTSAMTHRLPYEELSAPQIHRRFPVFHPGEDDVGIYEPEAGVLFPEVCVQTLLDTARELGADLHFDEPVLRWSGGQGEDGGVSVETPRGTYRAHRLLFCAGAWVGELLKDELRLPLEVQRNVVHWFTATGRHQDFQADRCPIYVWEHEPGAYWYGFPETGEGVKVALHYGGEATTAQEIRRQVDPAEVEEVRRLLRRFLPDANGRLLKSSVCMYTNTPDAHFLIDTHPRYPQVLIASPCSGHGFKFASVLGEILADLLCGAEPAFDLAPFRLARLA